MSMSRYEWIIFAKTILFLKQKTLILKSNLIFENISYPTIILKSSRHAIIIENQLFEKINKILNKLLIKSC